MGALSTGARSTGALSTGALSTEALEAELVGLAGHLAAAHHRWLRLLAEFDEREGWAGPGLRSCAHWLSWRVGMSLRTGFEQLRVAHALTALPRVSAAFAAGRVSYSKVRAITRVATPETEESLLDLALGATANQVERVVRHARQARSDPMVAHAGRYLDWRWDDDGTLVVRGRLTAEQGVRLIAALDEVIARNERVDRPQAAARAGVATAAPGVGDAAPRLEVDRPERAAPGSDAPRPTARPAAPEPTDPPAAPGPTDAPAASGSAEGPAESLAARRTDALVELITGGRPVNTEVLLMIDADRTAAGPGSAELPGGPALPMRSAERIGCPARVRALLRDRAGNPLYLGRSRRLVSRAQLTALRVRDRGRCRFPGCEQRRRLVTHHIVPWSRGGPTDVDNLVMLCGHHHRLVHEHGYRMSGRGTGVTFHRPDGRPIPEAGGLNGGDPAALVTEQAGLGITTDTLTPDWAGDRLDLALVLAALFEEPRAAAVR